MDIETRRRKQQALLVQAIERKVRSRAQQLYESRGQVEGRDLQDWFQAESEVVDNTPIAPLYRRTRRITEDADRANTSPEMATEAVVACDGAV